MISEKMMRLGKKSSVIREIFEYGNRRRSEIGEENVFDFSLGNPSVPAPEEVGDTLRELLDGKSPVALHGYTSASGNPSVRRAVAEYISSQFGADTAAENVYMTCGAAASLSITLTALVNDGDEVIVLAPFFPEYRVFIEKAGAKVVVVPCREGDFQIDFDALGKAVTPKTKAIIVNSPNNPTGVVFSRETVVKLAELLKQKSEEFGGAIYVIADEPYRELVYGGVEVPYIPNFYDNTVVCYSFSKSLSLPGERIGYIFVSPKCDCAADLFAAVCGAGRSLGYVCAPSMMQYLVAKCLGKTADISVYDQNRRLLYDHLTKTGFTAAKPDGAFYLFVKAPGGDAAKFCEMAKKYELLLVPSDSFGIKGYVRISYCVDTDMIRRALPKFTQLMLDCEKEKLI